MRTSPTTYLRLLFAIWLLASLGCAMPTLVPTAVPLPSPTPTWPLLPAQTPSPSPTATPIPHITLTPTAIKSPTPTDSELVFSCPEAPAPQVQVGDTARVTFTDGVPLRIRTTPEVADDNVLTQITEGAIFLVIGGPVCAPIPDTESAYIFWEIELEPGGLTGWVAEGDETTYYIETIP